MVVSTEDAIVAVPFESLIHLEVSRGQKSGVGRGARRGLLIGGLVGAGIGLRLAVPADDNTCEFDQDAFLCIGASIVALGLAGTLL